MDKNVEKFIKLVQEHPDLPVIPMVAHEVVCSDEYDNWMASFGDCEIGRYWLDDDAMFLDEETFIEHIIEKLWYCNGDLSEGEQRIEAEKHIESWFPAREAIIVYIDLPKE